MQHTLALSRDRSCPVAGQPHLAGPMIPVAFDTYFTIPFRLLVMLDLLSCCVILHKYGIL